MAALPPPSIFEIKKAPPLKHMVAYGLTMRDTRPVYTYSNRKMRKESKTWSCVIKHNEKLYGKDREQSLFNGNYMTDEQGELVIFTIEKAINWKHYRNEEFRKLIFCTKSTDPTERVQLTPVERKEGLSSFRFPSGYDNSGSEGHDGESLSHELAIKALSRLKTFNFLANQGDSRKFWGKSNIRLTCTEVYREHDVTLSGNNKYRFDLLIKFDDSQGDYYVKWGGKLGIEVKYTSGVSKEKRWDLENHGYPVIEIELSDYLLFWPEINGDNFTEEDIERHIQKLVTAFEDYIANSRLISDPVSVRWHVKAVHEFKRRVGQLQSEIEELSLQLREVTSSHENQLSETNSELLSMREKVKRLKLASEEIQISLTECQEEKEEVKQSLIKLETDSAQTAKKLKSKVRNWRFTSLALVTPYIIFLVLLIWVH
ncbi:hypothetical protein GUM57_22550 [Vibrio parahaemolyticus]|nr:hypothetical protein [Vibrio parahaemolyticus]